MIKKRINSFLNLISDKALEITSFVLLLLWVISPVVEYIFKNHFDKLYTHYFTNIIYVIGSLGILIYIFYIIKLNKKKKIDFNHYIPEILIFILLILSINSTLVSDNSYLSIFGESYRKEGLLVYVMYIGFALLASIIKDSKYIKYIFNGMIISCLFITIIPLFGSKFTYINFANIFHNTNHYGYYLMINTMITLFMFISNKKIISKILYMLVYIFFLFLLIRNNTFGCYLAMFITLVFLLVYSIIKKHERLNVIIVFLVFVMTSFFVSRYDIKVGERVNFDSTKGLVLANIFELNRDIKGILSNDEDAIDAAGSSRGILWKEAGKYIIAHPVFGGGMESLKYYYSHDIIITRHNYSDRPHNIILQVAAFIGIPGGLFYLIFIMYLAFTNLKIMKDNNIHIMIYCTAACYFISSLFGNSMYYTSPYFVILLGFLIGFNRRSKLEKTN